MVWDDVFKGKKTYNCLGRVEKLTLGTDLNVDDLGRGGRSESETESCREEHGCQRTKWEENEEVRRDA